MAKRTFTSQGFSWTATASGSVIAAANIYMAVKGGSSTQTIDILEILLSGKATVATVAAHEFARTSTLETGSPSLGTNVSDGPNHPATAALAAPPVTFTTAATTHPAPSNASTDAKLQLGMNALGGIVKWTPNPYQQWSIVGNAVGGGESILFNSSTAGGNTVPADAHIMYEPL